MAILFTAFKTLTFIAAKLNWFRVLGDLFDYCKDRF